MGLRNTKNYIEISMYFSTKVSMSLENDPFCEVNFQKKKNFTTYGQFHERKKA